MNTALYIRTDFDNSPEMCKIADIIKLEFPNFNHPTLFKKVYMEMLKNSTQNSLKNGYSRVLKIDDLKAIKIDENELERAVKIFEKHNLIHIEKSKIFIGNKEFVE